MATRPAPRIEMTRTATRAFAIADISSVNVTLTDKTKAPKHAPQLVRLNNATAAALSAVLVPEQTVGGTDTLTVVVNAGSQYEVPLPIKQITAAGSGALSAICYWWASESDCDLNP